MTRIVLILCLVCRSAFGAYTVYHVATNGLPGNSGLTLAAPIPMTNALANHVGRNIWIDVQPGVYDASKGLHGGFQFFNTALQGCPPGQEFVVACSNQNQAAGIIMNGTFGIAASTDNGFETPCTKFINLQICSNAQDGVIICSNAFVIGCWIHDNGQNGINSTHTNCNNSVIDSNLVEGNGAAPNTFHYHGGYFSGWGYLIRNNVFRNNRDGTDFDIYTEDLSQIIYGNKVYNNLIYGGTNEGFCADIFGATFNGICGGANPGTNYLYGNTIFGSLYTHYGTLMMSNNIILPATGQPILAGLSCPSVLYGDYNAGTVAILGSAHEIVTTFNNLGFVDTTKGLWWLTSASAVRGHALSGVFGPVDFFGNPQASVTDIGFNQYSVGQASDVRNLNQSQTVFPLYWTPVACPIPTISTQPQNATTTVGSAVSFTVIASGATTYAWTENGNPVGGNSFRLTLSNPQLADNAAAIVVTLSNSCGTTTSSTATLTVNAAPTSIARVTNLKVGNAKIHP